MNDLDDYLAKAESALMQLLKEWHPKLTQYYGVSDFDMKENKTVVTELDKSLELAIKDVLRPISAEVGFMGEEHGQEGSKNIFWLVDPIDGTEQYIRGMDGCRTLLCLIMNDEPVYAFAYKFITDELYTAQKNKGAFKNGEKLYFSSRPLDRSWVEMSINMQEPEAVAAMARVATNVNAVMFSKDFLRVTEGFVDAHIVYNGQGGPWDYAPRALLMKEAGARISNVGSDSYDYKNLSLIAAHPDNFDELAKLLSPTA